MMNIGRIDEDWNETDEKLKDVIKRMTADEPDFWGDGNSSTDLSFLDQPSGKEKAIWKPMARVAAVALIILTAASGLAIWITSDPASAFKFELEKKFYEFTGKAVMGTDEEEAAAEENYITYETDTMDDIDEAKKVLPELPVPEYIPDGYTLQSLTIEKDVSGDFMAFYQFAGPEESTLMINIHRLKEEQTSGEVVGDGEKQVLEDRTIYYAEDISGNPKVSVFINDVTVFIYGIQDTEELIEIGKSLK